MSPQNRRTLFPIPYSLVPTPPCKPQKLDCETVKPPNQSGISQLPRKTAGFYSISTPVKFTNLHGISWLHEPSGSVTATLKL
jgi:hypothetical protein